MAIDVGNEPPLGPGQEADHHPLWSRLATFDFDASGGAASPGASALRTFTRRLGEERGWSPEFTARVVEEYRRFLFLAVAAGHPVCPSEDVDAAWHLHLTFTRSYWQDLCSEILRGPLHHDASGGGPAEAKRHRTMYRRTLAAYRTAFGTEPPADIWPPAWARFDAASRIRSIDLRDHWVFRRPRWWPRSGRLGVPLATVPLVALGPLFAEGLGPFDMKGPDFLLLYGVLWLAIFIASLLLRAQRDVPAADDRELAPEEIACLAHGPRWATRATVAGMLDAGDLTGESTSRWSNEAGYFRLTKASAAPTIEGALAGAIRDASGDGGRTLAEVESDPAVIAAAGAARERLREAGWFLDDDRVRAMRTIPTVAFTLLLLAGLAKIGLGITRGRPVEFLVIGCIATAISIVWASRPPRVSRAGERLVATLRARHRSQPATNATEVVLLAGLFGAAALASDRLAPYKKVWQTTPDQGSGGNVASGCGAGGCGAGGGGCGGGGGDGGGGGCGGGGCGGCGGGGD